MFAGRVKFCVAYFNFVDFKWGEIMRRFIFLCLLLSVSARAAETRQALPGAASPQAIISDLAWLAGPWDGNGLGGAARVVYSPPDDGQIVGHFKQSKNGKIQFYEIAAIAETKGSLEYRVKHFNADLTAWEEKDKVQTFPLVAVEKDAWYFDGLTIRRDGENGLIETVLVSRKDGTSSEISFTYRRAK